jgi:hypothetical protein
MGPSPFPAIPPVPGVDHARDQVLRLRQVARDNPDWEIGYDARTQSWHAYKQLPNGTDDHYRRDLKELLDLVEKRAEEAAKAKANEA